MQLLWDAGFPGIYIDPRTFNQDTFKVSGLGMGEGAAFTSATRKCLELLAAKPVGKDLLTLISKRCQGIGSRSAKLTCRVMFGQGTLTNRHGNLTQGRYISSAVGKTFAGPDIDFSEPEDVVINQMAANNRRPGRVGGYAMVMAGKALPALVSFNPFINYDIETQTAIGVPMPAFVALAHELVHALHTLSGDKIGNDDSDKETMIEEARTVGAGKYAQTRISENAIRAENGYARRQYYAEPGDCDGKALA
jgi:hypothetical protein